MAENTGEGISRRTFLKAMANAADAVTLASVPVWLRGGASQFSTIVEGRSVVYVGSNGLSVGVDFGGGIYSKIDVYRTEYAKTRAVAYRMPETVGLWSTPDDVRPVEKVDVINHPVLRELPSDVMREDELSSHGIIRIHQTDNGTRLWFRRTMLNAGMPLVEIRKKRNKLDVVLFDGPFLWPGYTGKVPQDLMSPLLTGSQQEAMAHSYQSAEVMRGQISYRIEDHIKGELHQKWAREIETETALREKNHDGKNMSDKSLLDMQARIYVVNKLV